MRMNLNKILKFTFAVSLCALFVGRGLSSAAIIPDDPENKKYGWKDESAYKPNPVLFLHGFAFGNPKSWNKIVADLISYFEDYTSKTTGLDLSVPYLERINFDDPNGSVDTYPNGRDGWADKIRNRIIGKDEEKGLLDFYKFKNISLKLNLICHSMSGLAAREYITNLKYTNSAANIDKLITIATPHAGSPFANIKKIEDVTTGMHKYVWDVPTNERVGIKISSLQLTDDVLQFLKGEVHLDPEGEDLKDMRVGSPFLKTLNYSRTQPSSFKNYAIYGETFIPFNGLFSAYYPSEPWTCGDGIVPRDSQIGIDIMSRYPDVTPHTVWSFDKIGKIPTDHFTELNYPATPQKILAFLDSSTPEFELTSPEPNTTTEIYETSLRIQGRVYKEYLPADSKLHIKVVRDLDGLLVTDEDRPDSLKPSDLWIPNNPDSPVAEFDEKIELEKPGTYTISATVTNPADFFSDTKTTMVKVTIQKPVIYIKSPSSRLLTDRRTLIEARVYSRNKISIDLSSIELKLDGVAVDYIVTPETGGSDITISYIPLNDLSINDPNTSGINEGKHTIIINAKDVTGAIAQETTSTFEMLPFCPQEIVELMRAINQRQRITNIDQTIFYNYLPTRTPKKISLGLPDGGDSIPSLDALGGFMFLPDYILDLRKAIEDLLSHYWNSAEEKPWTLKSLYQSAMATADVGAGKDSWTHYSSQMSTNGIETIDLLELQKCIEKLDSPMILLENNRSTEYYQLHKFSSYNPRYQRYGSYNDSQNATPDNRPWGDGGHACGQLAWLAYNDRSWNIARYYWSFDTSVISGLDLISAKLKWQRSSPLTNHKYYRHFWLNFRQTSFDVKSPRIPSDWGKGATLVASRSSETWNDRAILIEQIPISFINISGSTQFELTSSRDEAKDEPPMPAEEGEGTYEQVQIFVKVWVGNNYVDNIYLIVTVTGLKN